jgi:hypothetical protein
MFLHFTQLQREKVFAFDPIARTKKFLHFTQLQGEKFLAFESLSLMISADRYDVFYNKSTSSLFQ